MVEYNWTSVVHKAAREIEHKIIMKPLLLNRVQIWDFKRGYCSIHIQHLCSEPENTCTVEQHTWIVIYSIDINTYCLPNKEIPPKRFFFFLASYTFQEMEWSQWLKVSM